MELADHVDHIAIFSGDGDFRRLVESVQRRGVRVSVVSTMRSQPPMVADELRRQADCFVELADLIPRIGRQQSGRQNERAFDAENGPAPISTTLIHGARQRSRRRF